MRKSRKFMPSILGSSRNSKSPPPSSPRWRACPSPKRTMLLMRLKNWLENQWLLRAWNLFHSRSLLHKPTRNRHIRLFPPGWRTLSGHQPTSELNLANLGSIRSYFVRSRTMDTRKHLLCNLLSFRYFSRARRITREIFVYLLRLAQERPCLTCCHSSQLLSRLRSLD